MLRFLFMALLALLSLANPAAAQLVPLSTRNSTDFMSPLDRIEGDVIPGTLPTWTAQLGDPDGQSVLNGDGTLTLTTTSAFDRWINTGAAADAFDSNDGWTWEARVRVDSVDDPSRPQVFSVVSRDNTGPNGQPWIQFGPDGLSNRNQFDGQVNPSWTTDLSDFQTVRMAWEPGTGGYLFLNDTLLDNGIGFDEDNFSSPSTAFVGRSSSLEGTGTVTVDYVRFDTSGAFAPVDFQLPPPLPPLPERASSAFQSPIDQIEGDVIPGTLPTWTDQLGDPDGQSVLNGDGTLTLTTTSAFDRWTNTGDAEDALDSDTGWTWEARLKVDGVDDPTRSQVFSIVSRDDGGVVAGSPWIQFGPDGLSNRNQFDGGLNPDWTADFSEFQTVRMAWDPQRGGSLYLNGELLTGGVGFDEDNFFSPSTIFFGRSSSLEGTGTVTLDYIRFDTTGAFAPLSTPGGVIPEPATISLFLVASPLLGLRRRQRG